MILLNSKLTKRLSVCRFAPFSPLPPVSPATTSLQKNINDEVKEKNANRAEVIELVFKHIEECEVLEKKRFAEKLVTDRSVLFSGAASVKLG